MKLLKINWQQVAGNDLVDLRQAQLENNWQRKGFLNKICTAEEQEQIMAADSPEKAFWLRWSMKEAAYKIRNRMTGIRDYRPQQYVCRLVHTSQSEAAGEVTADGLCVFTRSTMSSEMIHSVAVLHPDSFEDLVLHQVCYRADYSEKFNASSGEYKLVTDQQGLPAMAHRKTGKHYPASVSHHGRYLIIMYSGSLLSGD